MKILSHHDITNLEITPQQCYNWVTEVIKNKSQVILPAKISMKPAEGIFYNVMPSILPQYNIAGVKVVNRYPEKSPSLDSQIMLYDLETGMLKAIMDGNYITAMRTGAVAAHSIKLFAVPEFNTISLIGLGNQARAVIKVLMSLYPQKKITFKIFKYKNQHILFQEYIQNIINNENIDILFCDTISDTVCCSDVIISSVTYFENDVCDVKSFKEGCLLVPIHTRGFTACDLSFDKIFADDVQHVKGFINFDKFKKFAEVSDVVNEIAEGRVNNTERILVYNIGLSIFDVYFAYNVYLLSEKYNVGSTITLNPPNEKFWV